MGFGLFVGNILGSRVGAVNQAFVVAGLDLPERGNVRKGLSILRRPRGGTRRGAVQSTRHRDDPARLFDADRRVALNEAARFRIPDRPLTNRNSSLRWCFRPPPDNVAPPPKTDFLLDTERP